MVILYFESIMQCSVYSAPGIATCFIYKIICFFIRSFIIWLLMHWLSSPLEASPEYWMVLDYLSLVSGYFTTFLTPSNNEFLGARITAASVPIMYYVFENLLPDNQNKLIKTFLFQMWERADNCYRSLLWRLWERIPGVFTFFIYTWWRTLSSYSR